MITKVYSVVTITDRTKLDSICTLDANEAREAFIIGSKKIGNYVVAVLDLPVPNVKYTVSNGASTIYMTCVEIDIP